MSQDIKKVGLIYFSQNSDWKSCNSILNNIITSYRKTSCEIEELFIQEESISEIARLCQTVTRGNFSHLAFIDHRLSPSSLLSQLIGRCENLPSIFIHVYGDFFLNSFQWNAAEVFLLKFKTTFICASDAQTGLLKKILNSPTQNLSTIPFPIDDTFFFSEQKRQRAREAYQLAGSDFALCYAGRISLQKNVIDLISAFTFALNYIPELKLLIAGPFDDIGIPYLGLSRYPLTMETEFYSFIESLSPDIRQKITYVGDLKSRELTEFYNASDGYVSLSTHNDEDFGMAPAEALCSGLPVLLSDWGGFRDFKNNLPAQVLLTEVAIKGYAIKPIEKTRQQLLRFICNNQIRRFSENSALARKTYSTEAISEGYSRLFSKDDIYFKGFNPYFKHISNLSLSRWPFKNDQNYFDDTYKSLYSSYFPPEPK